MENKDESKPLTMGELLANTQHTDGRELKKVFEAQSSKFNK